MSAIQDLGHEYWNWRASQQPRTHDDIPRIERPENWIPRWSPSDVEQYKLKIVEFEERISEISVGSSNSPEIEVAEWVDYQLIKSAVARAHFELNILRTWAEQPRFYIDQTIGVIFDLLTIPDVDSLRIKKVIRILEVTPSILKNGISNLTSNAVSEYAEIAIGDLSKISEQILEMSKALSNIVENELSLQLTSSAEKAILAFIEFRKWLRNNLLTMKPLRAIGTENYNWFLQNVSLYPYSSEEILQIGQIEWDRAVAFERIIKNRFRNVEPGPIPQTSAEQVVNEEKAENLVRKFYEDESILSQPKSLRHYLNAPMPDYLEPLRWLGVSDDLTGPSRLDHDGYSYVPSPGPSMPYFYAANARDTRAGIVHEGAHYQQLAISWSHERKLRQHYYDSGVNEGIAFYNEELMLSAGLFDDAPITQIVMWNFMKLRALRVIVDVNLATGLMDIETATKFLEQKVPMDYATAREEAITFSSSPGQAISYQIGKTQILNLLSEAVDADKNDFNLKAFHDYLWLNGNVPISLLKFELLSDNSDLKKINR
ncbi:MAG: DUF885 family protein [Actinobacteria bacterium]|uniref:Unannotated protein n=1 Tax=freshwater metagenome TaxID=449393 RepID=A0A6J6PJF0_9ZZZZ|nr:DUF885 family protein [Actinomycetota bacterium]